MRTRTPAGARRRRPVLDKPSLLLERLIEFDPYDLNKKQIKALKPYMKDPEFQYDYMKRHSLAAAVLVRWVRMIYSFATCP